MPDNELIPRLFREEYSKMVSVLSRLFGLEHIELAEDIVSETFLQASESWRDKGIPDNPAGWLYTTAKRKALYHFRRDKIFRDKILPELESGKKSEVNFSVENIKDSMLQMMFAICSPAIASESQIGLALRILCGFSIDEIAEAFLTGKETINKRLYRAKEKLRAEKIKMELPPENEISKRLDNVLRIIYLLFNEGYYSTTQNQILRKDLCLEALRLALLLTEFDTTCLPKTNALIALMCFHASRFDARQSEDGSYIIYENQDESKWDKELIEKGKYYFNLSMKGSEISSYHLEAQIAYWHCHKEDTVEKWENILNSYNMLLQINYSPSAALNRTYALYKARGRETALIEAEKLQLVNNHFYFTLLGELYSGIDSEKAKQNFQKAYSLAKTETEKLTIRKKIDKLGD
jgi:RNA polymerase sigma factor (sigma-70 family)